MVSRTWTSSRKQSHGYRTKMRGNWLRRCGRWCQRQQRDRESKGIWHSVSRHNLACLLLNSNKVSVSVHLPVYPSGCVPAQNGQVVKEFWRKSASYKDRIIHFAACRYWRWALHCFFFLTVKGSSVPTLMSSKLTLLSSFNLHHCYCLLHQFELNWQSTCSAPQLYAVVHAQESSTTWSFCITEKKKNDPFFRVHRTGTPNALQRAANPQ